MARRSVLLSVAIVIALLGTALIVLYVQGIDKRATEGQELVEVLAATDTIDAGESVAAAMEAGKFEKRQVRRDDMVEGALSSTGSISDLVALSTIYAGEQVIAAQVRHAQRHRGPAHPRRQGRHLGRAERPGARGRLRQPGLRASRSSSRPIRS